MYLTLSSRVFNSWNLDPDYVNQQSDTGYSQKLIPKAVTKGREAANCRCIIIISITLSDDDPDTEPLPTSEYWEKFLQDPGYFTSQSVPQTIAQWSVFKVKCSPSTWPSLSRLLSHWRPLIGLSGFWLVNTDHVNQILESYWLRNNNQIITDTICLNLNHLETIKLLPHSCDLRK